MGKTKQLTLKDSPSQSRWPHALRALRHRNFRLFWFGQLISLNGSWMQIVALNWLVYRLTASPLMLGLVNFVALLPVGFVSLLSGVISDRFPRKNLILIAQATLAIQALGLAILTWSGLVQVWHIMIFTFIVGAASTVEQPARIAFLMDIVGKDDFANAVGLNSSVDNLARTLGPVAAGLLIGSIGEASCFFVNFVTYLAIISAFLLMQPLTKEVTRTPVRWKVDFVDGLKYLWQNQSIKTLLLLIAATSFLSRPYIVLMPVFARDVLQVDSRGYGLLMGTVGVGAICGALFAGGLGQKRQRWWMLRACVAFPIFLMLFACSDWMPLSVSLLFLTSLSHFTQQVSINSTLQLVTDDEFRGRVASLFSLFTLGLMRLGGMQAGAVAQGWSAPVAVAGGAFVTLIWVLILLWRMPLIRQLELH
jgi:MFS family permease